MIILPVVTPAAVVDQSTVNQAQQTQSESSQQSRKASDTVQVSSKALELASAQNESPQTQRTEVAQNKEYDADRDDQQVRAAETQAADSAQKQRAPERTKIDVVA